MGVSVTDLIAPTIEASTNTLGFKSQWALKKALSSDSWDHIDAWWEYYRPGDKEAKKKPWDLKHYGLGSSSTSDSCTFLRNDPKPTWKIYPIGPWKIGRVNIWIKGKTDKDKNASGWYYSQDLVIRVPAAPKIDFEVERKSNGAVSDLKIAVEKGKYDLSHMNAETDNYDTCVRVVRTSNTSPTRVLKNWIAFTEDSKDIEINSGDTEQGLLYNEWVRIEAEAYSRGCAGDGAYTKASHIFAWPSTPQITKVAVEAANNVVMIGVDSKQSTYHPVDTIKLQRLKDSSCETSAAAALETGWADVSGMSDTGNCKGLSDNLIDARPAKGKRTWYRVVAQHDEYVTYSSPVDLGIYQPKVEAKAGAAAIMAVASGDDGESVVVDVAWNDDTFLNVTDPSEKAKYKGATLITWANTEYAWQSTGGTSDFEIAWEDDSPRYANYKHSARVYIGDLTEGEDVFVRVRRTLTSDEETVNGAWSEIVAVKPASAPSWVDLTCPSYIARGEALSLSWTFGSEAAQTGWMIVDDEGKVWGQGEDSNGYCVIDSSMLQDVTELSLYVSVTTGGDWKRSPGATAVKIVDAPTCSVEVDEVIGSLPFTVLGESNADVISYFIVSRGITYESPQGQKIQYANDIVWSAAASPGEIEVSDAELLNGCTYDLRAQAIDADTGLVSEIVSVPFKVELERRAPYPSAIITPNQEDLSAEIVLENTDELEDGDTYEVYRMTHDGIYLIAENVAPGSTVIDRFAPYQTSESAYRIAVRTPDGDRAWSDFAYELIHSSIRLDWQDSYVELEYNIAISEGISKSFESRAHLDGSIDGYWDKAASHQAKFSTDVIRFESKEQQRLLREMGRYPGSVFVRTGSGLAFDANVDVEEIEEQATRGLIGVSLNIEEITLSDAHKIRMGDIISPAESEEEENG